MHMIAERVSYLFQEEIDDLLTKIKHSHRPSHSDEAQVIHQAVALVRNGSIESYTYGASQDTIIAAIQGVEEENVQLSLPAGRVTCTCTQNGWCAHRVGVLLHLYSQYNSLTNWLHDWRRTETEQMVLSISERTPAAWNEVLIRLMEPLRSIEQYENPATFIHEFSLIEQKVIPLSPFEWEWKPLFDVYVRIHALEAAWHYVIGSLGVDGSSFSYGKWYIQNWLTNQIGKLKSSLSSISSKPRLFQTDPFYDELKKMVRHLSINNPGLFEVRLQVYCAFWEGLFTEKTARIAEQTYLQQIHTDETYIFQAFFARLLHQSDQLQELVQSITSSNFLKWLPIAEQADEEEDQASLAIVLNALLPFVGDHMSASLSSTSRYQFVRKLDGLLESAHFSDEQRESLFFQFGEFGMDAFADFLVERNRFGEWAALMHRNRVSYEVAEAGGLRAALANDPEAVIPLLHIYATNLINERNRQSYKRAIRIFKKMKSAAKKSGKADFWNQYIETVREKNRRLRALMEEMEKGNLIL